MKKAIGILELNGKYVGVAGLAAKEVTDKESYIRRFGLSFEKDIQWHAISSLLDRLARSPMFKAVLITTRRITFKLELIFQKRLRESLSGLREIIKIRFTISSRLKMMQIAIFTIGIFAGLLGSMLGVGGGFLIVPLLVLILDIPMHLAVGISITSVVMTSVSSSIIYAKKGLVDFKLGIFLEMATTTGALVGSYTALLLPEYILEIIFGVVLIYASLKMVFSKKESKEKKTLESLSHKRLVLGLGGSFIAGIASGMLGIGGGTLKVPILVLILGIATRTAIATSTFMIGLTASVASLTYQAHGLIDPIQVAFIILGIFIGVRIGSHIAMKIKSLTLKRMFGVILFLFALRMLLKGLGVNI